MTSGSPDEGQSDPTEVIRVGVGEEREKYVCIWASLLFLSHSAFPLNSSFQLQSFDDRMSIHSSN